MQQYINEGVLLQEGRGEVFQVFNQGVVGLRPVHGEVKAVFVALRGVGKISRISAVRDHEQLQIFVQ